MIRYTVTFKGCNHPMVNDYPLGIGTPYFCCRCRRQREVKSCKPEELGMGRDVKACEREVGR
jgi:hypothetical protein